MSEVIPFRDPDGTARRIEATKRAELEYCQALVHAEPAERARHKFQPERVSDTLYRRFVLGAAELTRTAAGAWDYVEACRAMRATTSETLTLEERGVPRPPSPRKRLDVYGDAVAAAAVERATVDQLRRAQIAADRGDLPTARELASNLPRNVRALHAPSLSELCVSQAGKYKRIPTTLPVLDEALNGGLQTNRLVILGGAPGVTKTTFALFIAERIAREGTTLVYVVAADESREGLLSRLSQMHGARRSQLESEDLVEAGAAWASAAERLRGLEESLVIWDPLEDGITVEQVAEHGKSRLREPEARFDRLVLIVDSLQVAPFDADESGAELTRKQIVDARLVTLKALKDPATCIIAVSELNRGAYSGQGAKPDLGSFKDSGSTEYAGDVLLTLARVKGEDGVIEILPQKSRQGGTDAFRVRRLPDCTFEGLAMPASEASDRRDGSVDGRVTAMAGQMERALLEAATRGVRVSNREQIFALVPGNQGAKVKALALLKNLGRFVQEKGAYRVDLKAPSPSEASGSGDANEWGQDE